MAHRRLLSPAERFHLTQITVDLPLKDGHQGQRYRRFCRQLGLDVIRAASRAQGGDLNGPRTRDERDVRLFELDEDVVAFIGELHNRSRTTLAEDILGNLFDWVELVLAKRQVDDDDGTPFNPAEDRPTWEVETFVQDGRTPPVGAVADSRGGTLEPVTSYERGAQAT
jgi:hypothetical protein